MVVLGSLGVACGLFLFFGSGVIPTLAVGCAAGGVFSAVCFVVTAVSQRPRVVITPQGFAFHGLIGGLSHKWEDIDGPFAVIKIGLGTAGVAYKLTADCKARVGKKPTPRFLGYHGYDETIVGAFQLSAEELAELLNAVKRSSLAYSRDEEPRAVALAQTSIATDPAPAQEGQAKGNGSPILRVAAGVLALLLAGFPAFGAANGKLALGDLVFMQALALMFGWYAVRGREGLPRFLTKTLGACVGKRAGGANAPNQSLRPTGASANHPSPEQGRGFLTQRVSAGQVVLGLIIAIAAIVWRASRESTPASRELAKKASAVACYNRGVERQGEGQLDEAIRDYTEAVELDSSLQDAYLNRGLAYGSKGDLDAAIRDFAEVLRLNPQDPQGRENLTWGYYERGLAYAKKGQHDKWLADFTEVLRLDPSNAEAFYNRGVGYLDQDEYEKAIADFTSAIGINAKYPDYHHYRGLAYEHKGEHDKAITDFTVEILVNPEPAKAYCERGFAYSGKGEVDEAIADYSEAIRLNPRLAEAYRLRAVDYGMKGDYDKAIADFTGAIRQDPGLAGAYADRGGAYLVKGDPDKAIADCTEAIRLLPTDVGRRPDLVNLSLGVAYHNRGVAYMMKGEKAKAEEDFAQAKKLGLKPQSTTVPVTPPGRK